VALNLEAEGIRLFAEQTLVERHEECQYASHFLSPRLDRVIIPLCHRLLLPQRDQESITPGLFRLLTSASRKKSVGEAGR